MCISHAVNLLPWQHYKMCWNRRVQPYINEVDTSHMWMVYHSDSVCGCASTGVGIDVGVCACVYLCVRVYMCARACVRACVHTCAYVRACVRMCVRACMCVYWLVVCFLLHEQSDEVAIPPAGSVSVLSERQSRVLCELEERVNDLEQKANIYHFYGQCPATGRVHQTEGATSGSLGIRGKLALTIINTFYNNWLRSIHTSQKSHRFQTFQQPSATFISDNNYNMYVHVIYYNAM